MRPRDCNCYRRLWKCCQWKQDIKLNRRCLQLNSSKNDVKSCCWARVPFSTFLYHLAAATTTSSASALMLRSSHNSGTAAAAKVYRSKEVSQHHLSGLALPPLPDYLSFCLSICPLTYIHTYIFIHMYRCTYIHVQMYTCIHMCIYIYFLHGEREREGKLCIYIYIDTYIHMCR